MNGKTKIIAAVAADAVALTIGAGAARAGVGKAGRREGEPIYAAGAR